MLLGAAGFAHETKRELSHARNETHKNGVGANECDEQPRFESYGDSQEKVIPKLTNASWSATVPLKRRNEAGSSRRQAVPSAMAG